MEQSLLSYVGEFAEEHKLSEEQLVGLLVEFIEETDNEERFREFLAYSSEGFEK